MQETLWSYEFLILLLEGESAVVFSWCCGCISCSTSISGEATIAVQEWWSVGKAQDSVNVSAAAAPAEAVPPNTQFGAPRIGFEDQRRRVVCNGQLSDEDALLIAACDPYTSEAYEARTGLPCETFSFRDVALGQFPVHPQSSLPSNAIAANKQLDSEEEALQQEPMRYDMVICSFALHLLESPSEIWALLTALGPQAKWLVILAPHKKPEVKLPVFIFCEHASD